MKRIPTLLVLLALLVLTVWLAATWDEPAPARALDRSAPPAAESTGEVPLAPAASVAVQREQPARVAAPVVEDIVESADVGAADEFDEVRATLAVATHILAVAIEYRGHPLAERELELAWREAEEIAKAPQHIAVARTDADGAVRFEIDAHGFADRAISLRVKDTASGAWAWSEAVVVTEGDEIHLGTLILALPRELYPEELMSGRVTQDDLAPVPGVVGSVSAPRMFVEDVQIDGPTGRWEGEVVIAPTGHFSVYGPPTAEYLSLSFAAEGYGEEDLFQVEVPSHGLEVFLARSIRLRGRLLVPEHGPPVTGYGVWLSEEGKGIGISPGPDGRFAAIGSTRSLEVKVTQPGLGLVLFRETFALSPEADGELGTIDVRDVVKPLDLVLVDGTGAAIANEVVWIEVKDVEPASSEPRGQATTDASGRLFVAVPTLALEAELTVSGRAPVAVDLVSPPPRVMVP